MPMLLKLAPLLLLAVAAAAGAEDGPAVSYYRPAGGDAAHKRLDRNVYRMGFGKRTSREAPATNVGWVVNRWLISTR